MNTGKENTTEETDRPILALPKLINEEELYRMIHCYPGEAILSLVRTEKEFMEAVRVLVRCPVDGGNLTPAWIESLIRAVYVGSYPFEAKTALLEWYAASDTARDPRLDRDVIRAFRFLFDEGLLSCSREDPANKAVRRFPYLYWCHLRYRKNIEFRLRDFLERKRPDGYSETLDWQDVERAIRRVVQAGDHHFRPIIAEILEHHLQGKMQLEKNSADPFAASRIVGFLGAAVRLLDQDEKEQNRDVQEFGMHLRAAGKLRGSVYVRVGCGPLKWTLALDKAEEAAATISFECPDAADAEAFLKLASEISIQLELEGACFSAPFKPAFEKERYIVSRVTPALVGRIASGCFLFTPFGGKHRFWLTLSHGDFSMRTAYYIDVEDSSKPKTTP